MGSKAHQMPNESPTKVEVGEIDTRAPFASVKAAVSLFGEVAVSSDKQGPKRPKAPQAERVLAKETEFHLAQKELNKYKERLSNAETTRVQALAELDRAKKAVEELTSKLDAINKSKEQAIEATEAAKLQTKQLENASDVEGMGKESPLNQELDSAREHYAVALSDLDAAKQELRRLKKDFDASLDAKLAAVQKETEAKTSAEANEERASQLVKEIETMQGSLTQVKLATEQAQQEELKIRSEKDAARRIYLESLEAIQKNSASLRENFDTANYQSLQRKLDDTNTEIGTVRKKIEETRALDLESFSALSTELSDAKELLGKIAEEESSLKALVVSLKRELENVKKEHDELKQKDADTESAVGDLHVKLQKCKAELEAAVAAESKATSASDDLMLALQQLSSESKTALQEAEVMRKSAEDLREEAQATQALLADAEQRLQAALREAEEAKDAEAKALAEIKRLSEKAHAARASTSEAGDKITISKEEYESLSHKVEESEKLSEMKVTAALAQVEAVKASEDEAMKRLEAVRKETEEMELATEEALKRAEMAEAAKRAVEGELRRWREKEQKQPEISPPESEAREPFPAAAEKTGNASGKPSEKGVWQQRTSKLMPKKAVLPNLVSLFKRKSHADGSSPSHPPGERRE